MTRTLNYIVSYNGNDTMSGFTKKSDANAYIKNLQKEGAKENSYFLIDDIEQLFLESGAIRLDYFNGLRISA